MTPETRYAKSGAVNIAYQVVGDGPLDLVLVPGWVSHVEFAWTEPSFAAFLRRLASFSRLIILDRRGTGLSDRVSDMPTLEERMDDVRAVMDAADSQQAALLGISEGGPMCTLFAATYPERTSALILYGTIARGRRTEDYPWGLSDDAVEEILDSIEKAWGTGLTALLFARDLDRILATLLFVDIVGSTARAAELGDRRRRELLERFYAAVRTQLRLFRGIEVNTTGDGFLARFDGPARAIRCARSVRTALHPLGIDVRSGLHTGECELIGDDLGGIAVHLGARVADRAAPGEILVSSTVKDLVAGSGLTFADTGVHPLKGIPGEWRLFALA